MPMKHTTSIRISSLIALLCCISSVEGWNHHIPVQVGVLLRSNNRPTTCRQNPQPHHVVMTNTRLHAGNADDLQGQARKLRDEIDAFERQKTESEQAEKRAELEAKMAVQKAKDFYSAVVPILKPDGSTVEEKVEFTPVSKKEDTCIVVLEASLPLGMLLEEGDMAGTTTVVELAPDSNAKLGGVQEGDVLRACTACEMNMEAPTWQLLAGGIGVPKTKRMMYVVDQRPFEEVMDAIGSNRMDPEGRPVILVVERKRQ